MPKLLKDVPLREWSNYKIGGPARYFFAPKNEKEIAWAVNEAKRLKLRTLILGGGTNLLIDDAGFDGLVLQPNLRTLKVRGAAVIVGAGIPMEKLLKFSVKNSLGGLEWAGGLPGTFGGAIRGNAGCFGGEIKDAVVAVRSLDTKTMKVIKRKASECRFGYRTSIFKERGAREIILDAALKLKKGDRKNIAETIKEKIEYRAKHHPLDYPNIGSIFKNVPLISIHKKASGNYKKALQNAQLPYRGSVFSVKKDPFPVISSAKLISEAGLRGVSAGGAMISGKHPNFIVNVLEAGSIDVKNLIQLAKSEVMKKFGVALEEEVQII